MGCREAGRRPALASRDVGVWQPYSLLSSQVLLWKLKPCWAELGRPGLSLMWSTESLSPGLVEVGCTTSSAPCFSSHPNLRPPPRLRGAFISSPIRLQFSESIALDAYIPKVSSPSPSLLLLVPPPPGWPLPPNHIPRSLTQHHHPRAPLTQGNCVWRTCKGQG